MGKAPIEVARDFIRDAVLTPALQSGLPISIKGKVRNADQWISRFSRVGDLLVYLKRFKTGNDAPMYKEMKLFKLTTFEDIVEKFEIEFGQWASDCSRITDFVIGSSYDVHEILILARNYQYRAGGMFVLEANGQPVAAIIKASLDGPYKNEWIEEPTRLKYYLKSISGKFGTHFKANNAIITTPDLPILTFVRRTESDPFVFYGMFKYEKIIEEEDDKKAFVLALNAQQSEVVVNEVSHVRESLEKAVRVSSNSPREQRLARLAAAPKKPIAMRVISTAYYRSPDVISEVLFRAKGVCEGCNRGAPFNRKSNGTPFLEVHHRLPLAEGGDDTVENAIALCPNCHRERHFG
jgi:5-methylcytosine-specific restriction protein A